MQDPFYHKEKRRKKARMLDADAWLDSAIYEFWHLLGRSYTRVQDGFAHFRVAGLVHRHPAGARDREPR